MPSPTNALTVTVNGRGVTMTVPGDMLLADFLRYELELTGTHVACGAGPCGSCTVLVDGAPVRSCLMLAIQAQGRSIETIESIGSESALHPVQAALQEYHGLQCGFCTPGLVMSAVGMFRANPHPDKTEIAQMLQGHLCRCTGYQNIIAALESVAGINARSGDEEA